MSATNLFALLRRMKMMNPGNVEGEVPVNDPEFLERIGIVDRPIGTVPNLRFNTEAGDDPWTTGVPKNLTVEDPELDRIRRLYTQDPEGVRKFRNYLATAPSYEDNKPSNLRKGLSALLAGVASYATGNDEMASRLGANVRDAKYNTARRDYEVKGRGLEKIAELDIRSREGERRGEEAVQRFKDTKEAKQAALDEKIREANLRHEEALQKAKDEAEKRKAEQDYKNEMLQFRQDAQRDNLNFRKQAHEDNIELRKQLATPLEIADPDNPGFNKKIDRVTGKDLGESKVPAGTAEVIHSADAVKMATSRIRVNMPKVIKKIGPFAGNLEEFKQKLGVSKDADARQLAVDMDNLTKSHAKIFGSRAGVQMFSALEKSFKNINQDPKAFEATLKAIDDQADDFKKVRMPKKKKDLTPDDYEETEVDVPGVGKVKKRVRKGSK